MARGHDWNWTQKYSVELELHEGQVIDISHENAPPVLQPLAAALQTFPEQYAELIIEFRSTGSYSPQTHWEPEAHYEDRELEDAYLWLNAPHRENRRRYQIPRDLADQIFEYFAEEIDEVEPPPGPEPYDRDDYDDRFGSRYQPYEPFEQIQKLADTITEDPDISSLGQPTPRCPECGSSDTEPHTFDGGALGEWDGQYCNDCGNAWDPDYPGPFQGKY